MRDDMHKLLCLRPRYGHKDNFADRSDAQEQRSPPKLVYGEDEDGEYIESDAPKRGKMGRFWRGRGTKEFGEYFAPLRRWLESQINRPWDKVYADLRTVVNKDSAVRAHALVHLDGWMERHCIERDGKIYRAGRYGSVGVYELSPGDLYVHPRTGLFLKYKPKEVTSRRSRWSYKPRDANNDNRIKLNDCTYLCRIKGIWYSVTYEKKPAGPPYMDGEEWILGGVTRVWSSKLRFYELSEPTKYTKKQLSKKELRKHKLENGQ